VTITDSVVLLLVFSTMIVSWLGLIIPIFPGLNIIWIAALGWGIYTGLAWPGWLYLVILTILMILGNLSDNVFISGKAKISGASWWSIVVGNLAGIAGAFILPPLGGLLFAVLGVLIVEVIRHRDWKKGWETSKQMFFGFGWSIAARMAVGVLMIGLWAIWAF
jgi:uncharacterized protein